MVLRTLTVENLLLIERADLDLSGGLNVLTGETGAGKTLLATALGLLLGDRSRAGLVKPGAAEAFVEGTFDIPSGLREDLKASLPADAESLVVARRVWPDGRSRAFLCGRTTTVAEIRDLTSRMISFHGQHEHQRLMLSSFQMDLLDSHCGDGQAALRGEAAALHGEWLAAVRDLEDLSGGGDSLTRELDLLRYELEEIDSVAPDLEEKRLLVEERDVLRSSDSLREGLHAVANAINPDDGGPGAYDLIAGAEGVLGEVPQGAGEAAAIASRVSAIVAELGELGRDARSAAEGVIGSPDRLQYVDERLDQLSRLERKHGGSIESVLAHAAVCRRRLADFDDLEGAIERAEKRLADVAERRETVAAELSRARQEAAPVLGSAVEAALADLSLEGASFSIEVGRRDEIGASGFDRVEFLLAANPGLPPRPLSEAASGGELSRVLLAVLSVAHLHPSSEDRLLVFDEIDAGIGGRTAVSVGRRLADLGARGQVLCITHLAQVAAMAGTHFRIAKSLVGGQPKTTVERLDGNAVVGEMVRMLGADEGDAAATAHATELLAAPRIRDAA